MQEKWLIYGASVTVTKENLYEVTSEEFVSALCACGCKAIFYVEYVQVSEETQSPAPQGEELEILDERLLRLCNAHEEMLFVSFTGEHTGECVLFEKRDRVERIMNGEDDANA